MTLTKEWLQQTISELEEERDATPGAVNEDASMALAAMKIALASLEAEPAGWQVKKHGGDWVSIKKEDVDHYRFNEELPVREVYTAPPAPVSVPDESAIFDAAIDICRKSDAIDEQAWNHGVLAVISAFRVCRAAMLNKEKNNE
ncbi:TPA: hypothetical protein MBK65_001841 [Klebsiella pneumoniae]|jgi:hypothetical protein|uniref:hypothetical protein n=1 Tax=Klebsiella/Raoultella group TaxID=2890311 RepID=UPI000E204007|nr:MULTISPECIES: hypothetical protein [Klebsiella/Raoultella group]MCL7678200.1 hypothetical protein [Klebsiella pneumoniae]MCZ0101432.1 hypothetical protein [Raoultella ornithinolytica]MDU1896951.1 hypothetical protein [Klebsiella pneumoniae]MEC6329153.1 hypothetical protein [Klebsiella pneumoniae]SVX00782.1 Uncharacterised protein [Klebsiella pneumoniae]